jgi:hypothetical protein
MIAKFSDQLFDKKDDTSIDTKLTNLLSLVRKHLNMDVAFISEFIKGDAFLKL